jgi:hypothetical protein
VKEDGVEVCTATPCVVTFQGEAASPTASHTLTIAKAGFTTETRAVPMARDAKEPIAFALVAAPAASSAPSPAAHPVASIAPTASTASVAPVGPAVAPKAKDAAASQAPIEGFKDLPY